MHEGKMRAQEIERKGEIEKNVRMRGKKGERERRKNTIEMVEK